MPKYNLTGSYGPVIIYLLGGGGAEDCFFFAGGGITWYLGEQKEGSVVTEFTENFGRITAEGGPLKFAWKMKTLVGRIAKVNKCY